MKKKPNKFEYSKNSWQKNQGDKGKWERNYRGKDDPKQGEQQQKVWRAILHHM